VRRLLTVGALALVGVAAPVMAIAAGSGPAGASGAPSSKAAVSAARTAVARALIHPALFHQPILGKGLSQIWKLRDATNVQSTNWSGYADISDTYQSVTGTWQEPTATCTNSGGGGGLLGDLLGDGGGSAAYASFWVGLDGYSSSSVEQTGTDADCTSSGQPSYYAWYEMFPAGSVDLSTSSYPVTPGDTMTGTVTSNNAGDFVLTLHDAHYGWTYTFDGQNSNLARSSAEWVAEAPSVCPLLFCSPLTLADYGTVTFSNASATDTANRTRAISGFTDADITMSASGTVKAVPGPLNSAGNSFNDAWMHS
jgi:hypothetical protein